MAAGVKYTDTQRDEMAALVFRKLRIERAWTQEQAGRLGDVNQHTFSTLLHTFPDGMSFGLAVKAFYTLDIDPNEAARILGLADMLQENLQKPELEGYFPILSELFGSASKEILAIEQLLKKVPQERRELARTMIINTLETFSK